MTLVPPCTGAEDGSDALVVSVVPRAALGETEALWRPLARVARPSFFLSWPWIGCWLAEAHAAGIAPSLVVARRAREGKREGEGDGKEEGRVVGLALVVAGPVERPWWRRLTRMQAVHLHQCGQRDLDSPYIEYNGVLARPEDRAAVARACLRMLVRPSDRRAGGGGGRSGGPNGGWDAFHLSGIDEATVDAATVAASAAGGRRPLRCHIARRQACPTIDLDGIRGGGTTFLDSLSRNTRQQIRRSMRLYEADGGGSLCLRRPADTAEALVMLDRLAERHQRAWQARGEPGSFAREAFTRFHRRLVAEAFGRVEGREGLSSPDGIVDLIEVTAGERPIGSLYNFVHAGIACSYQSGLVFSEDDARLKPGLVCHALAAQDYLDRGLVTYRLLAGDARYKASLATGADDLYWITVQRDRLVFRLEEAARTLKRRLSPVAAAAAKLRFGVAPGKVKG